MEKVLLEINNLSYSHSQSGAYVLELSEVEGNRSIPIVIGSFEAQSIAIELENMTPSRPLTHDLFKTIADAFQMRLNEVLIDELVEGIFHAKLVFEWHNEIHHIDARTSDAIAIALRFKCPIYALRSIVESAGISREEYEKASEAGSESQTQSSDVEDQKPESSKVGNPISDYANFSVEELNNLLQKAIDAENYEVASKIRDEINRRSK